MGRDDRPEIRVILNRDDAKQLNEELLAETGVNSIDTEWFNYDKNRGPAYNASVFCLQLCWERDADGEIQLVYIHNHGESAGNIHALAPWLRSERHTRLAHNFPADFHAIANEGIIIGGEYLDSMVMDHLVDENRENMHGLKECVDDYFGVPRLSFAQTYGSPKLRKDGQPVASGQLVVPPLDQVDLSDEATWLKHLGYACDDAWDALMLYKKHRATLAATPWLRGMSMWDYFLQVDAPITKIICKLERKGMTLDVEFLREMSEVCESDLQEMLARACEWAGCPLNIGSDKQLGHLLYGTGLMPITKGTGKKVRTLYSIPGKGWPVLNKTPGGAPSCSADSLKALRRHLEKTGTPKSDLAGFDWILNYSKYSTQKGTFLDGLIEKARNGRLHGRINQIGTTSSRFSASDPNLQNITTGEKDVYHVRDCFTSPLGYLLIVADWAQLEYRLLAHFSQDPTLLRMFTEGWDMHSLTTAKIFPAIKREVEERFRGISMEALKWVAETYPNERKKGKTLNFEIIYGVGHKKLAEQLRIEEDAAKQMIDGWFRAYPFVKVWMNRLLTEYRTNGFTRLLDGRMRHANLARLQSKEYWVRGEEERTLVNAKIQGSAAAMARKAMIRIDACEELRALGYEMTMQVHDEILGECPIENCERAVELIRPIMEQPFSKPLRVAMPVSIGIGPSWSVAKV